MTIQVWGWQSLATQLQAIPCLQDTVPENYPEHFHVIFAGGFKYRCQYCVQITKGKAFGVEVIWDNWML